MEEEQRPLNPIEEPSNEPEKDKEHLDEEFDPKYPRTLEEYKEGKLPLFQP